MIVILALGVVRRVRPVVGLLVRWAISLRFLSLLVMSVLTDPFDWANSTAKE
jgi:hypothetical protein